MESLTRRKFLFKVWNVAEKFVSKSDEIEIFLFKIWPGEKL